MAYLLYVSLSGTSEYVVMWIVVSIGSRDLLFVRVWVVVTCNVMVSPWVSVIRPWWLVSCLGKEVHSV